MKIRSRLDYLRYVFNIKRTAGLIIVIDSIILVLAIVLLYQGRQTANILEGQSNALVLLVILALLKNVYNARKLIRRYNNNARLYRGAQLRKSPLFKEEIPPSKKERSQGFRTERLPVGETYEYVMLSDKINGCLQSSKITQIRLSSTGHQEVMRKIKRHGEVLLPFLSHQFRLNLWAGKNFINEKKLCLSEDLSIDSTTMYCHKGTYFDSFLTNERFGKYLVSSSNEDVIITDARAFFPVKMEGNLKVFQNISESDLNHHIGVSTIAFTKDNHLVLFRQNSMNMMSEGLLAPTGSGSCDFEDLQKDRNGNYSFSETIKHAMERELIEEGLLKNAKVQETKIIGFFRWMRRGGKPEFVGITKLKSSLKELSPNEEEVDKRLGFYVGSVSDLPKVFENEIRNHKYDLSVPLEMNIRILEDYLRGGSDIREEMGKFIA